MELTQQPTQIEEDPRRYIMMIYGDAGVGKTTMASEVPGHYFAITEPGIQGVRVYGSVVTNWTEFLELCKALVEGLKSGWKDQREVTTLVVDTYENLYEMLGEHICKNEKFVVRGRPERYNKIEDVPWGKGFKRCNTVMLATLQRLSLYGFGLILISHVKERVIQWKGKDVTVAGPNLVPSAADAIINLCGAVGYLTVEEEVIPDESGQPKVVNQTRWMYWQPTFTRVAKHRLPGFPERLPLPYGRAWETYVEAFRKCLEAKDE